MSWGKKVVTRTLIIAYAIFLLKPVMPIIMDALAHAFYRSVHIAVVHRVHGKEHVHYELRKAAAESENSGLEQKHKLILADEVYTLPVPQTTAAALMIFVLLKKRHPLYRCAHYDADMARNYPPPKQVHPCAC